MKALGLLLSVMGDTSNNQKRSKFAREIGRYLTDKAVIKEDTAYYNSYYNHYTRYLLYHSVIRTDAMVLDGLCSGYPESPVIPKLLKHLMISRKNNCWYNTQDNCWCNLAINKYFRGMKISMKFLILF